MKTFDIFLKGKFLESVRFASYEDARKVYPAHFGYVIKEWIFY